MGPKAIIKRSIDERTGNERRRKRRRSAWREARRDEKEIGRERLSGRGERREQAERRQGERERDSLSRYVGATRSDRTHGRFPATLIDRLRSIERRGRETSYRRFERNSDESRETQGADFSASMRVFALRETPNETGSMGKNVATRNRVARLFPGGGAGGEGVKRSEGRPHRGLDVVCRKPGHPANALVGTPGSFVPPSCVTDSPLLARLRSPSRTRFKPAGHAPRSIGHRVADRCSYAKIRVRCPLFSRCRLRISSNAIRNSRNLAAASRTFSSRR